jgi:hypothetical protein
VNTHRNLNFVQLPNLVNDPSVDRRTRIIAWKSKNRSLKTPPLCVLFDHGKRMNRAKRDYSRKKQPVLPNWRKQLDAQQLRQLGDIGSESVGLVVG